MKADVNSWHARVYSWWYTNKYHSYQAPETTNLCPYMRAVMFWAPIRFLFWGWIPMFYIGEYKDCSVPTNVISIPLIWVVIAKLAGYGSFGVKHVLLTTGGILLGVALVIVLLLVFITVLEEFEVGRKIMNKIFKPVGSGVKTAVVAAKLPNFFQLLGALLRSAHDGVCPPVEFVEAPTKADTTIV